MSLKFSIITPVLNGEKTISRTINSILRQDYSNIEYIIVDGGSTDSTIDIIKRFGNRIRYISETDKNISDAVNKGFLLATGDIVVTMPGGDYYETGVLKKVAKIFESNLDIDVVYGGYFIHYLCGSKKFVLPPELTAPMLIKCGMLGSEPAIFVRSHFISSIGLLDINKNLSIASLYEWYIRILLVCKKTKRLPIPLFTYVEHRDAHSGKNPRETARQCWIAASRHGAKLYHPVALQYFIRARFPLLFAFLRKFSLYRKIKLACYYMIGKINCKN